MPFGSVRDWEHSETFARIRLLLSLRRRSQTDCLFNLVKDLNTNVVKHGFVVRSG
jgi:hypothetical protein